MDLNKHLFIDCNGPQCSCKKKEICCIGSCKCMAQITCANKVRKVLKITKASQDNILSDDEENSESE